MPPTFSPARRRRLAGLVANGLAQSVVGVALVLATGRLLAGDGAVLAAALVVGATTILAVLAVIQAAQAEAFALAYVKEVRLGLLDNVLTRPADLPTPSLGPVMSRAVSDLAALKTWLASGLAGATVAGVTLAGLVVGFAWAAPTLLLPLLPAGVLFAGVAALALRPLRRSIRTARRERGRLAKQLGDRLPTRLTHLHFGRLGPLCRAVERRSDGLATALVTRATWAAALRAVALATAPLTLAASLAVPALGIGAASAPEAAAAILLLGGLVGTQLGVLARAIELKLADGEARRRLGSFLDRPTLPMRADAERFGRQQGGTTLVLDKLVAAPDAAPLSTRIEPGEVVAFAGGDQATRRRLGLVLAGLADPVAGSLSVGSRQGGQMRRRDWWRIVTLVSPDVPTLRAQLRARVCLGMPSTALPADVDRALAAVALHDTELNDDRAADLEPRLRLARALLRGAAIIVVDDQELLERRELVAVLAREARCRGLGLVLLTPRTCSDVPVDRELTLTPSASEDGGA